jgi:hypothetical protein
MTFDSWTTIIGEPFFSVTGHYIWNPPDKPLQWELKNEQLDFSCIEGNHSGHNIARILVDTIDRFSIRSKVSLFKMFCISIRLTLLVCAGWMDDIR